ncbi:ATP-binding cassette domain-containing protein [Paenibacillus alkalitolerans]|uniref:ATP-binding cassette domain-containing protein n=1 Tax=Paenibacillus alkalitolerans TaxID=2799335 RepID=UPI001F3E2D1B|nr:ATP-binding cassette domain-containing protein [Paenibacillus alkalitolerans]
MADFMVETRDLTKRFGATAAVDKANIRIRTGEVYGLLGPNGAGKSTTIKMLCTFLRPTSGTAAIEGSDTVREGNQVRRRIGIIFQDPSLDDRLTGRENLELHCMFYHVPKAERQKRIEELLTIVDLSAHAERDVRTYSGGMKRRLEIARGLLHEPRLLILDEPTIGLDPQTRKSIWEYIHALQRRTGLTILMTTHYLEEAEACHNIGIMDKGKIIAEGSPEFLKLQSSVTRITVESSEADRIVANYVQDRSIVSLKREQRKIVFEVGHAESFLPTLFALGLPIDSLSVQKPSLDDVFLKLTGRQIREEEADAKEQMRNVMKIRGRRT